MTRMKLPATGPEADRGMDARGALIDRYRRVRGATEAFCQPLETEDYVIQTMPDVSPTKWHLGHTSWFFERFILHEHAQAGPEERSDEGPDHSVRPYRPYREPYDYLFNSYYNAVGPMHCRPNRGLLSRPTVEEVYDYRRQVDGQMLALLSAADDAELAMLCFLVQLGLNHEQQHQELMATDLKHVFSTNPLLPAYRGKVSSSEFQVQSRQNREPVSWMRLEEGVRAIGRDADDTGDAFCYDNETPRHKVYLRSFELATRPVTNGEFLRFVEDGGYTRPEPWLSPGWATVKERGWTHPIYWYRDRATGAWMHYTLAGPQPVDPAEPVCHVSYFEADAFARWAGARLPTEAEWEVASEGVPIEGSFADNRVFHPRQTPHAPHPTFHGMFGDVWEWTSSPYTPYPGYRPWAGAIGEYNGKFMCNQFVLRGGSCATPRSHIRRTYRNFFPPDARWQFAGLRLARDA